MKLAQCISEFIFPTENHLVICSAHERKAPGHLKVGHISALTTHFPFSNTGVKSLIFFSSPSTSPISLPADLFQWALSLSLFFAISLLCLSVVLSWICKRQCVWLSIKLTEPADEQGILAVPVFMSMCVRGNHVGVCTRICVCAHRYVCTHMCWHIHMSMCCCFLSLCKHVEVKPISSSTIPGGLISAPFLDSLMGWWVFQFLDLAA